MYTLKKSLGQHFLRDESYIIRIVDALQKDPFSRLLEVGPGGAALTRKLLDIPGIEFRAVELDAEKVQWLEANFPAIRGKLIHQSFLDMERPFTEPFTVIGNFPYNISSQILFRILDWKELVPVVIGMFQKEVAVRAAASPGTKDYGVLSVLVQAFYSVEYLFDVPPGAFNPPPKVTSGVIRITRKTEPLNARSEKEFRLLVKTAFNQRRKMLRNAVRGLFAPEILADKIFDKRAEALSINDFETLTFKMN